MTIERRADFTKFTCNLCHTSWVARLGELPPDGWQHLGSPSRYRQPPLRGDLCPSCAAVNADRMLELGFVSDPTDVGYANRQE